MGHDTQLTIQKYDELIELVNQFTEMAAKAQDKLNAEACSPGCFRRDLRRGIDSTDILAAAEKSLRSVYIDVRDLCQK